MLRLTFDKSNKGDDLNACNICELNFADKGLYTIVIDDAKKKSLYRYEDISHFEGEAVYDGKTISGKELITFVQDNITYINLEDKTLFKFSALDGFLIATALVGKKYTQEDADRIFEKFGILGCQSNKLRDLSLVQRYKLAFAVAYAKESRIIIFKNTFCDVSSEDFKEISSLLKTFAKDKLVVVFDNANIINELSDCVYNLSEQSEQEGQISGQNNAVDNLENDLSLENQSDSTSDKAKESMQTDNENSDTAQPLKRSHKLWHKATNSHLTPSQLFKLSVHLLGIKKLIAYIILVCLISVCAILSTTLSGQNKVIMSQRYIKESGHDCVRVVNMDGEHNINLMYRHNMDRYAGYVECDWQAVSDLANSKSNDFWADDEIGKINYAIELYDYATDIFYIEGKAPANFDEIAIPYTMAEWYFGYAYGVEGKYITINTGGQSRRFCISGVFEPMLPFVSQKYTDMGKDIANLSQKDYELLLAVKKQKYDSFLNRSVVLAKGTLNEWLDTNSNLGLENHLFACKKDSYDIEVYNAEKSGISLDKGQIYVSTSLDMLLKSSFKQEYESGNIEFEFSEGNITQQLSLAHMGIIDDIQGYAIVLSAEDYEEYVGSCRIAYTGMVADMQGDNRGDLIEMLKDNSPDMQYYVLSNAYEKEFFYTLDIIEDINYSIMLPVSILLWIINIVCVFVLVDKILSTKRDYIRKLRDLGMSLHTYLAFAVIAIVICLSIVATISICICGIVGAIVASLAVFVPNIFVAVGSELIGLSISFALGAGLAILLMAKRIYKKA